MPIHPLLDLVMLQLQYEWWYSVSGCAVWGNYKTFRCQGQKVGRNEMKQQNEWNRKPCPKYWFYLHVTATKPDSHGLVNALTMMLAFIPGSTVKFNW